jgi:hypothetical protein
VSESLFVAVQGPRRRGRPRAEARKGPLTTWVPLTYHDRLAQLAIKHGVSVSSVLCRVIQNALDKPPR